MITCVPGPWPLTKPYYFWNLQRILWPLPMVEVALRVPGLGKLYQTYLFLYLAMDSRTCRDIHNNKAWSNRPRPDTYGAASIRFPLCRKCAILCLPLRWAITAMHLSFVPWFI